MNNLGKNKRIRAFQILLGAALLLWSAGACKEKTVDAEERKGSAPVAKPATPPKEIVPEVARGLEAPMVRPDDFMRGVSLGLFVRQRDPEARRFYYQQLVDEIAAAGATDISIVVRWVMDRSDASKVYRKPGLTAPDEVLEEVVEMSKKAGLRVFLLPIIHLDKRKRGEWRGTIKPADADAWWASYEGYILHYAKIAQKHDAAMISVGSELVSMEAKEARWREVIRKTREVYKGKLTYSANWDHFEPVQYWDALDVVGVTAYQELSKKNDPSEEELVQGWGGFRSRLKRFAASQGRDYIFTEVGFPSHTQGAARPWDYSPKGEADVDLQLSCFRSMFRVWDRDAQLDGFFVWNWYGVGGEKDLGYTPRGKPSEAFLTHWFKGSKQKPAR